ncbi:hypothetical protein AOX55_00003283 [Sinorhizobium fredii CCBAU 25509]|nr:hypothetical protein AOX55_00003283 [Sinorhizobium fredii CCBAU 25509]
MLAVIRPIGLAMARAPNIADPSKRSTIAAATLLLTTAAICCVVCRAWTAFPAIDLETSTPSSISGAMSSASFCICFTRAAV